MKNLKHSVLVWIRWGILALAILNLFLFLAHFAFSGVEFRYWYDGLALGLVLIVAAVFFVVDRRWTNLFAALLTLPMVLLFCYAALKVHGILPPTAAEKMFLRDAPSWRQFLWNHPQVLLQYFVAFIVFIIATVYFARSVRWKRVALQ